MAAPGVYFGTLNHQSYERAPKPGMDAGMVGFSETGQLENGGAYAVQSMAAHQELKPDWAGSNTELQRWRAYQQGKWGAGPFYWIDPYAANLMCPQWGMPFLTTLGDWRPIYPLPSGQTAATSTTSGVTNYFTNPSAEAASGTMVVAQNLVAVPQGTLSGTGWSVPNVGTGGAATSTSETTASPFPVAAWVKLAVTTAPSGGYMEIAPPASNTAARVPVTAGVTYVASIYGYASIATTLALVHYWYDSTGAQLAAAVDTSAVTVAGVAASRSASLLAPTGAVSLAIRARFTDFATLVPGVILGASAARVTPSTGNLTEDAAYFDGANASNIFQRPEPSAALPWTAGTGPLTYTTTSVFGPSASGAATQSAALMTFTTAPTAQWQTYYNGVTMPVTAGNGYVVSAGILPSWSGGSVRIQIAWGISGGTTVYATGNLTTTVAGAVARLTSPVMIAPAGAVNAIFYIIGTATFPPAGSTILMGAVSVTPSTGNTEDDAQYISDFTYAWAGTANASVSNKVGQVPYTISAQNTTLRWRSGIRSTTRAYAIEMQSVGNASAGITWSQTLPVGTYTLSGDVYVPVGSTFLPKAAMQGAGVTLVASAAPLANGTWQRLTLTFTTTAATAGSFYFYSQSLAANGSRAWVDSIMITDGAGATYFDGNSPGAAWTGAVNASTSTSTQSINWPTTGSNQIGATYTVNGAPASSKYQHVLLVPRDRNLYFGVSGSATGTANVTLQAFYRDGTSTMSTCTLLSPNGATRTNVVLSGATVAYVKIYLAGLGTITLNDMTASLQGALTGQALDGQGTWALRWGGAPSRVYTYVGNTGRPDDSRQEMTATLIESYL